MSADQQAFLLVFIPGVLVVLLILFAVSVADSRDHRRRERDERPRRIADLEHELLHTQRWPGCSRCQWGGPVADWRDSL